jgi:hypothetical protein
VIATQLHWQSSFDLMCVCVTGFLEAAGANSIAATPAVASDDTKQRLAALQETKAELEAGPASDIGSSITLVWACMEALPRILTGAASLPCLWAL